MIKQGRTMDAEILTCTHIKGTLLLKRAVMFSSYNPFKNGDYSSRRDRVRFYKDTLYQFRRFPLNVSSFHYDHARAYLRHVNHAR